MTVKVEYIGNKTDINTFVRKGDHEKAWVWINSSYSSGAFVTNINIVSTKRNCIPNIDNIEVEETIDFIFDKSMSEMNKTHKSCVESIVKRME